MLELVKYMHSSYRVPFSNCLCRKNGVSQKTLDKKGRSENMFNKIYLRKKPSLEKILLIDDVFTTGATMNECARALKLAGTKVVGCLSMARD